MLTIGVIVIAGRLFPRADWGAEAEGDDAEWRYSPQTGFALLLIAAALVLTLVPEFVYLRDNFSTRMNTVFKFYYQAWLMFAIAGAYGVYAVFAGKRIPSMALRAAFSGLTVVVLVAGLLYPILGIPARMFFETGRSVSDVPATLDGGTTLGSSDDYQAAMCLGGLVTGNDAVIASAVGGSYHGAYGLVSTLTGIPTVLNWPGHELQWRGATYGATVGSREGDIGLLYTDPTWNTARTIINKYGINYVFFGSAERNQYGTASEIKFLDNLETVCEFGGSHVFRVPEQALVAAQ